MCVKLKAACPGHMVAMIKWLKAHGFRRKANNGISATKTRLICKMV